MRRAEERATEKGISVATMMERAGAEVARKIRTRYAHVRRGSVVVVAGMGNNGGDGFVAARHLAVAGWNVNVFLLGAARMIKTDEARMNWEALSGTGAATTQVVKATDLALMRRALNRADLVIDAIFGTGVRGMIGEPQSSAIKVINASKAQKVAIDIPSGLDPLTGEAKDPTVRADLTITLHRPKQGLRAKAEYTGEIIVASLGIQ